MSIDKSKHLNLPAAQYAAISRNRLDDTYHSDVIHERLRSIKRNKTDKIQFISLGQQLLGDFDGQMHKRTKW